MIVRLLAIAVGIAGGLALFAPAPARTHALAAWADVRPVAAPVVPVSAPLPQLAPPRAAPLPGALTSNPIAVGDDPCGWNVAVALDANGGALRHVEIAPGETFSFNATMGSPAAIAYQTCMGVPGGNWCNLAARYAQVARHLGLTPQFEDHGLGDLGGGPENSVAIWNIGGQSGSAGDAQDLEITNTTDRVVTFQAQNVGGAIVIEGVT